MFSLSALKALKDSKEVEVIDMKIRRKDDPGRWPLPGLMAPNHTDFSQLINCPEFVPRQMAEEFRGQLKKIHPASSLLFGQISVEI